jgi:hypothetical protein
MNKLGMEIKHPKRRGEWAEMRFMVSAAENGLCVTKPWGDCSAYDFAVEHNGHFLRVQVKSTDHRKHGGYSCTVRTGTRGKVYVGDPFDWLAAFVIPENLWYIIPANLVVGRMCILLYPERPDSRYTQYLEAWSLLKHEVPVTAPDVTDP